MRILARVALLILGLSFTGAAIADPSVNAAGGIGAKGRDIVAYQSEKRAVRGQEAHTVEHQGVRWRFASAANAEAFRKDPARYLPAYGGFCAYGVAQGYKVDIDPDAFTVVEGRLYLNYSRSVRSTWEKDIPGYVVKADGNWPALGPKP